jgi:hypothetical protein
MKSNPIVPQSGFFVTLADGHGAAAEQIAVIDLVNRVLGRCADKPTRRLCVSLLMQAQVSPYAFAASLGYTPRHCYNIASRFEEEGVQGLIDRPRSGRPPKEAPDREPEADTPDPSPQIVGRTRFGGLWLLLPLLLASSWWAKAPRLLHFAHSHRLTIRQWLLTVLAACICGLKRLYHLSDVYDVGLALFTGRRQVIDQSTAQKLLKDIQGIDEFVVQGMADDVVQDEGPETTLAIDEHLVPRWTEQIPLPKARVATRGRVMKAQKLVYVYDLLRHRVVGLVTGDIPFRTQLLKLARTVSQLWGSVRLLFDAGGYGADTFNQLDAMSGVTYLTRASNYANSVRQWEVIPPENYDFYLRQRKGRPLRRFLITETWTSIRGCEEPIRTIVLRDPAAENPKKRFTCFFTNDHQTSMKELADEYPIHWRQENSYRVLVHDLALHALPKDYHLREDGSVELDSTQVKLIAWLKGRAFNLMRDFGQALGGGPATATAGTLVRKFIVQPATLYLADDRLQVVLDPFPGQMALQPLLEKINKQRTAIPQLGGLVLDISIGKQDAHHRVKLLFPLKG